MTSEARDPYRVVTVCWGNICRSPMAEYMLREAIEQSELAGRVSVASVGTSSEERGNPMDRRTREVLHRHNVTDTGFDGHRARRISLDDADADLIVVADQINLERVRHHLDLTPDDSRVALLRSFDPAAVASGDLEMADPWYGDRDGFERTYAEIESAIPGILTRIRADLGG